MTGVTYRPASGDNYAHGRSGAKVELLVIHLMAGSMEGTAAWFADPVSQVSAHFGVGKAGNVHQYVSASDTAWHAGDASVNRRSIGIEHEGMHDLDGYWQPSREQLAASVELAAQLCAAFDVTPSRQTILLHSDVNRKKPVCPGPGFPIEEYVRAVGIRLAVLRGEALERPVRLFDPVTNTPIGEGTAISGTDKVYVKRLGPLTAQQPVVKTAPAVALQEFGEGTDMGKALGNAWDTLWVKGGPLGKAVAVIIGLVVLVLVVMAFAALGGTARAQEVDPFNPATWFTSTEVVIALVGIFAGWAVKLSTALGKDWFKTSGSSTVALSAILAIIIGGIGGYQALGIFGTGQGGFQGAIQAVFLTMIAFLGSNASAKADRQAAASGLTRGAAEADLLESKSKARLQ